jgi:HK97 family phage portal protein
VIFDRLFGKSGGGSRILTSQELAAYLAGGSKSASGVSVTVDRAMKYGAVFSCVRVLAESIGQLPLNLLQVKGRERVKAVDHPLYRVLKVSPNPLQTAQEFKEWAIASLALQGNAYSHINRVRGTVRELTPFTGSVQPKVRAAGVVTYVVETEAGRTEELPAEEVLHLKLFPMRGFLGASPLAAAREAAGLGIAAEQHGASLFANGAQPGGVLQTDQVLNKDVQTRLKESWEERHRGSENAGRVAVLEAGLKWASVSMPSVDAQWLESRKFQRSDVAGIYRVPLHLIGDLDKATFSNIEHQSLDFVVHTLMPYCTRIEERIGLQLLSEEERAVYFAKFNAAALLRGDMAARSDFYTSMVQNGALSPNEIRELEDLNPREGGDIYLTPSNMLIDGKAPESPGSGGGDPPK